MIPVVILQTAPKMQRNSKVRIGLLGVDDGHFDATSSKLSVHFRYFLSHAHMCTLRHGIGYWPTGCILDSYKLKTQNFLEQTPTQKHRSEDMTREDKHSGPGTPGPAGAQPDKEKPKNRIKEEGVRTYKNLTGGTVTIVLLLSPIEVHHREKRI